MYCTLDPPAGDLSWGALCKHTECRWSIHHGFQGERPCGWEVLPCLSKLCSAPKQPCAASPPYAAPPRLPSSDNSTGAAKMHQAVHTVPSYGVYVVHTCLCIRHSKSVTTGFWLSFFSPIFHASMSL